MSSFSSLMSSLQSGRPADNPTPTVRAPAPPTAAQKTAQRPVASASTNTNGVKRSAEGVSSAPTSTNGNKRKADSTAAAPPNKAVKLTAPTRDERPIAKALEKRPPTQQTAAQAYRGTMKAAGNPATQKDTKPASRSTQPVQAHAPAAAPVKRGFAALMAKATAAQETVKAKGVDTIKHKPTELVKKKDRQRMIQEAKEREKSGKVQHRSAVLKDASGTRIVGVGQKPRRPKTDLGYSGTMRGKSDSVSAQKNPKTKGMGQDKHGGYASWSDLDDAEDHEEDYYESESDMEEAGFDDMMEEELQATKIARQEDQREQAEEERLRREKLERKKRLMALSSSAAASKKRY